MMASRRSGDMGSGCLALFALPFAAVGVVTLGLAGSMVLDALAMSGWVETPAVITRAELTRRKRAYLAKAEYTYRWEDRSFTGDRVAISSFADNIGSFHQEIHAELERHRRSGEPFRCFVDPSDPARSILYRDLRAGLFSFILLFAMAFGGVGFGLLTGFLISRRERRIRERLRAEHPQEPWREDPRWRERKIRPDLRSTLLVSAIAAIFWNVASAPLLWILPLEVMKGNYLALIGLLFPAVGILIAAVALRSFLRWRRYRRAHLLLDELPVKAGTRLRGDLVVAEGLPPETVMKLTLSCVETVTTRPPGARRSQEEEQVRWSIEREVPVVRDFAEGGEEITRARVELDLPPDLPPSSLPEESPKVIWRLEAAADVTGTDLRLRFALPVLAGPVPT